MASLVNIHGGKKRKRKRGKVFIKVQIFEKTDKQISERRIKLFSMAIKRNCLRVCVSVSVFISST